MKNEGRYAALLLLTAAIWGFAMSAQREGSQYLSPMTFNACRFTLGTLVLFPLMLKENGGKEPLLKRKELAAGAILSAVLFLASLLQQMGVREAGAGKAGFLTALYVVLVPVLGILFRKKTRWSTWLALLLAIPALYLLCVPKGERIALAASDAGLLVGAVFWALHILLTDEFVKEISPIKLCTVQFVLNAALNWTGALAFETVSWAHLSRSMVPVLYCGVVSTGLGYLFQTIGQKGCRPAFAALIMSLESVFCVLSGALLLGERMETRSYTGCGLMLLAVVLAQIGGTGIPEKEKRHV